MLAIAIWTFTCSKEMSGILSAHSSLARSSISRRFVLCAILVFTFVVVLGSAVVGLRQAFDSPAFETSENSFFKTLASIMRTYFSAARPERTLGTCWAEDQTSFVAYSCTH